jgi:hypothetical protein
VLRALYLNKTRKIVDRETVRQARETADLSMVSNCFSAIRASNYVQKEYLSRVMNVWQPLAMEKMQEPFDQWKNVCYSINKHEIADKFFMRRAAKYVKAKALDAWVLYTAA